MNRRFFFHCKGAKKVKVEESNKLEEAAIRFKKQDRNYNPSRQFFFSKRLSIFYYKSLLHPLFILQMD